MRNQGLTQELNQTKKELKDLKELLKVSLAKDVSVRELSRRLAHEIKNPLSLITVTLQYLQPKINSNDKMLIATVLEKLKRLDRLASGLSSLARSRALSFKPQKINEVLKTNLHLIGRQCRSKNIKLETHLNGFLPLVDLDSNSIGEALLNILKNAVEATHLEGKISITSEQQNSEVIIKIKDSGRGIARKHVPDIFKPFYTTKKDHLGLGLAMAQKIIFEHGGNVVFACKTKGPTKGCEFKVHLPISQSDSWWKRITQ